jgi:hypothetical protein
MAAAIAAAPAASLSLRTGGLYGVIWIGLRAMDMRRFLPILLIAFAALFILPQLFKGSRSTTLSTKDRGRLTLDAIERIDRAQQQALSSTGKYTTDLVDLVARDRVLASELTIPLTVDLNVGAAGKSYLARVSSDVVSVAWSRAGSTVVRSCRVLKSRTGVDCPAGTTAPTATTVTSTTGTTTTTRTTGTITTVTTTK